jgi:glutamate-1-semialdehyde 2,1-aminomutase
MVEEKKVSSEEEYVTKFAKSRLLYEKAKHLFPNGVTHDGRFFLPFPIHITHASGSHMWDVDGYEYIDYFGGHGALLLGHRHPSLVKAINSQIEKGTHYGAPHELELEWAELIKSLVPSAELVQFTNSGTEAGIIGLRLARAFTGRKKIGKFRTHFHGQSSPVMVAMSEPWDIPSTAGLADSETEDTIAVPLNDEKALEDVLSGKEVAVLMVEPSSAKISFSFYHTMRKLTNKYGTLLLFDEVISGFRFSPGGMQDVVGVVPDLTMLGKIVGGGLPVGAIVGHADVMNMMAFKDPGWNRYKRVSHTGTWNANPLTCAAGIATLKILATGDPQKHADMMAHRLREGIQHAMGKRGVSGCAHGSFSMFNVYFGECPLQDKCDRTVCLNGDKVFPPDLTRRAIINLVLNGIHLSWRAGPCGTVSAAHTEEDIDKTVEAFDITLGKLRDR